MGRGEIEEHGTQGSRLDGNRRHSLSIQQSPFLTTIEASGLLRLNKRTLENMRWRGVGPTYRKHGGRVVYHISDLEGWSEKECKTSSA